MTKEVKQTLNVVVPMVVASVVAVLLYRMKRTPIEILVAALASLGISWAITARITKTLATVKPKEIDTTVTGGVFTENFDPTAYTDALYQDIDCIFCWRNYDIYEKLLALPSSPFRAVADDWNKRYYNKYKQSLAIAIAGENIDGITGLVSGGVGERLAARFKDEGLQ